MNEKISLVILEAYERDVGKGIARVSSDIMKIIDASSGDIIELAGHRKTAVKLLHLYPSDEKMGTIRVDGLIRNNVGANIGDKITIRKISYQRAEKVTVFALESIPPIDDRYLVDALDTFPVTKGDNIMIPYFGTHLTLQISNTKPDSVVVIDKKTIFHIENKNPGFILMESLFAHPKDVSNSEKLGAD